MLSILKTVQIRNTFPKSFGTLAWETCVSCCGVPLFC